MRKRTIILLLGGALFLSGCANIRSMLETKILEESGIADDPDYQRFLTLMDQGILDEEGLLIDSGPSSSEEPGEGKIHVIFADNPRIRVKFYFDADRSSSIASCNVDPGDRIYISTPIGAHPSTDLYFADSFRLVSYDSEYETVYSKIIYPEGNGSYITIPEDCKEKELTVQPSGRYDNRIVYISDYIVDEEGRRHELSGEWRADEEVFTAAAAEIPADHDLDLEYHYDPDEYYVSVTEPEAYSVDENAGVVYFHHETAHSEISRYEVQLHKWIRISLNGEAEEGFKSAVVSELPALIKDSTVQKIRCGDQVILSVKDGYQASTSDFSSSLISEVLSDCRYTFDVPEECAAELAVTIVDSLETYKPLRIHHGSFSLKTADGKEAEEGQKIEEDTEVTVTIKADEGYYVSGKDAEDHVYETALTYGKFKDSIASIINDHKILKYVSVDLEPKGEHGSSAYSADKEEITGTVTGLKVGQIIKADYELTDKEWQFENESDDVINNISNLIQNVIHRNKRKAEIRVNAEMDGETINAEDYIDLKKRGQ